mmetsp:Transcript_63356/g.174292  ORF Transcript_63356/g.174292 Transcript_63356/m.174292 type:complete len:91 (+) Transcript_63356:163-435(+)
MRPYNHLPALSPARLHTRTLEQVTGPPTHPLPQTLSQSRSDPNQVSRLRTVNQVPVSTEAGSRVAEEMGLRYMECSAMTQMGLKDVFGEF